MSSISAAIVINDLNVNHPFDKKTSEHTVNPFSSLDSADSVTCEEAKQRKANQDGSCHQSTSQK